MEGIVARIIREKRFGFIRAEEDKRDYFFHADDLQGHFEDLAIDFEMGHFIKVTFESVPSAKGLRAGGVTRIDQ